MQAGPAMANTWTELDLDALRGNLRALTRAAGGSGRVMAVVKADAYGHGLEPVAREARACGVTRLAVCHLGDQRKVLSFLHRTSEQHGEAGLTG